MQNGCLFNSHPQLNLFCLKYILITTPLWLPPSFFSFFPFHVFPLPLILFTPPPFVISSLHLCDQTANLWGCYFLLICRAPLLPISTSERLLLMVPTEENQPWIRTRPLPAFCRCAGLWECHISLPPLSPPRFNGNIMSVKWKYSQFIWLLSSHWNFLND